MNFPTVQSIYSKIANTDPLNVEVYYYAQWQQKVKHGNDFWVDNYCLFLSSLFYTFLKNCPSIISGGAI